MSDYNEGPYPIYGSEDENWQPEPPMPGENPVPQFESINYYACPDCDGAGGWWSYDAYGNYDRWIECDACGGEAQP
jgi:hypothetical protein